MEKRKFHRPVFGYENKEKCKSMYQKRILERKHADSSIIGKEGKRQNLFIKDFNKFMYNYTLYCGRKHICCFCLQAPSTEEILKCNIKE